MVSDLRCGEAMDELEKSMLSLLLIGKDVTSILADFSAELSKHEEIRVVRAVSGKGAWTILGNG